MYELKEEPCNIMWTSSYSRIVTLHMDSPPRLRLN